MMINIEHDSNDKEINKWENTSEVDGVEFGPHWGACLIRHLGEEA